MLPMFVISWFYNYYSKLILLTSVRCIFFVKILIERKNLQTFSKFRWKECYKLKFKRYFTTMSKIHEKKMCNLSVKLRIHLHSLPRPRTKCHHTLPTLQRWQTGRHGKALHSLSRPKPAKLWHSSCGPPLDILWLSRSLTAWIQKQCHIKSNVVLDNWCFFSHLIGWCRLHYFKLLWFSFFSFSIMLLMMLSVSIN